MACSTDYIRIFRSYCDECGSAVWPVLQTIYEYLDRIVMNVEVLCGLFYRLFTNVKHVLILFMHSA